MTPNYIQSCHDCTIIRWCTHNHWFLIYNYTHAIAQVKIVHGYSQISLLVAMQIMPCSCKIHAMSMSDCSCFWSVNNGLCAWSKGMTSCTWEKDSCAWNIGLKPLFTPSSCHEHAWTGHEHGMNCAWSYYDCGHKKHEIWAKIPKFHGCC